MSLYAEEIDNIVQLLAEDMRGAAVREVLSERAPNRIVLLFRGVQKNFYLKICVDAAFCRLVRVPKRPTCAEVPHPFVMLLRKNLAGRRLVSIETVGKDRVVRLAFQSAAGQNALVCELTGRHANIFLLRENDRIISSFLPNHSKRRKLVPNEIYVPPFFHEHNAPSNRFAGVPNLEEAVESCYRKKEAESLLARLRASALRTTTAARKKAEKLLHELEKDLEKAKHGEVLSLYGHVLKTGLCNVQKGMSRYAGVDFEGKEIIIPLDPRLNAAENMNRLFDKAKRLNRAVGPIENRIRDTRAEIERLHRQEENVLSADLQTLLDAETSAPNTRLKTEAKPTKKQGSPKRLPYREFTIFSGRPARVGRAAKDNDLLTLRHAKPDDLWLHVRNATGSHVVVPMGRKEDPHPQLLIDAAHLAAHFSSLNGQSDVEVLYTRRRYVQKPKGSAPGSVRLLKEKTVALRVDNDRVNKILHKQSVFPNKS